MKNYIIVAIVIILIIAGVVWYSNKGAVAPVEEPTVPTAPVAPEAGATVPAATEVPVAPAE
ncbi:MAG: hypothetical protein UV64_C0024G0009 [Parcubacteria group bacterium GW2011_GWC1_43_11b]|uniref:Uncharacterized protein n=2 Tax=Candidatus Vogeliibacteriota TaxID=1817922 RepID=A0A1G2QCL2_9BACT|nr:MAG: hypothetical protein UV50_C0020G0007 [Parcubacteria group bacterium GW2011_GWB1_42_9]KKS88357.1 MAG: hypothetical protein UV64_C0024G0009 [Parcubacteria group bacterium GW2011_GWC1_43_11b]KKT08910.1 MAG: hypothetical protein UV88_C0018G0002 [Parcubacteria group bacterium GW2011_GWA1_43_21]OHA58306.1 MAG: hypothetical protein A2370_01570 [Candidatus Vogelbacteria bacterium RIFOXYB1_FULL_42_16]OHA59086.1 MAG: hypothetical protein A2607_01100 [Candidatus Vogelbacteria bacterium RIFOXYD1_FU